jgi:hypothetical protein
MMIRALATREYLLKMSALRERVRRMEGPAERLQTLAI